MSTIVAPTLERKSSAKIGGKWKFVIGGLLILGAIAYVTVSSCQSNVIYYLTLKEFNAQRASLVGQPVRINSSPAPRTPSSSSPR